MAKQEDSPVVDPEIGVSIFMGESLDNDLTVNGQRYGPWHYAPYVRNGTLAVIEEGDCFVTLHHPRSDIVVRMYDDEFVVDGVLAMDHPDAQDEAYKASEKIQQAVIEAGIMLPTNRYLHPELLIDIMGREDSNAAALILGPASGPVVRDILKLPLKPIVSGRIVDKFEMHQVKS